MTRHFTVRLTFLDTFQKNSTDVTLERNRRRGCHSSLFVSLVDLVLVAWCLYLLILFLLRGGGGGLNYLNNQPVKPGISYAISVGSGGAGGGITQNGGGGQSSYWISSGTARATGGVGGNNGNCLLYTSPSPRD